LCVIIWLNMIACTSICKVSQIRNTFNEYESHNEHLSFWFVAKRIYGSYIQKTINKASLRVSEIMYWEEKKNIICTFIYLRK